MHFDDVGVIDLPRSFFDEHENRHGRRDVGIDHAYAVTSHGVQGATFARSTSRIDVGSTRAETYVDITRGRSDNHLFLTRAPDALDGERLPKAPPPHLDESVADRLRRSGPERAAVEFPTLGRQPPFPEVCGATGWGDQLPEPRTGPVFLRRRWAAARTATAAYRAAWRPEPGDGAWAWALGAPVAGNQATAERDALVEQLEAYGAAAAVEVAGATAGTAVLRGPPSDAPINPGRHGDLSCCSPSPAARGRGCAGRGCRRPI